MGAADQARETGRARRIAPGDRHVHPLEPLVQQRHHMVVTFPATGPTQHHAHQPYPAARGGGHEVIAGQLCVTRFQPIGAGITGE